MLMKTKTVLEKISQYRITRETFWINDKNGLGRCKVMIIGIQCNSKGDDYLKLIDMWELNESFDVIDYTISLKDVIKGIEEFEANEKEAVDKFNWIMPKKW